MRAADYTHVHAWGGETAGCDGDNRELYVQHQNEADLYEYTSLGACRTA